MKTMGTTQTIQLNNFLKFILFSSIFGVFLIAISSCISNGGTDSNSQRFSKDLDTSYKDNSTEIQSITRTFYKYEDGNNSATLTQVIGDSSYAFIIKNDKEISLVTFSNQLELKKFFTDMRTVVNNSKKPLNFKFGALQNGSISASGDDVHLFILPSFSSKESVSIDIKKSEIDSLESCFKRYSKEKSK